MGSALLIFGRWAYQSLTCGISDEFDTRASFLYAPLINKLILAQVSASDEKL